jgi:hypothetical protein
MATGAPGAPVIDRLDMPARAALDADGFYHCDGQIAFHDSDDPVKTLTVSIPAYFARYDFATGELRVTSAFPVLLRLAGSTPKGPLSYAIALTDDSGLQSAAMTETVTLQ